MSTVKGIASRNNLKLTCANFIATALLIASFQCSLAEVQTYYVVPTPTTPCPEEGVPCFTLSQYAAKSNDYFASTTTIALLPGNHTLESELVIRSVSSLKIDTKQSFLAFLPNQMIVTCSQTAQLYFGVIQQLQISGITFIGCMNNNITRVGQFLLEDCSFQGQGRTGNGLVLNEVTSANIVRSSFTSNTGTEVYNPFVRNKVRGGGAIAASNNRNVEILNSTFTNNSVIGDDGLGGVVLAVNSAITVTNSFFTNNSVIGDGGLGGVVAADNSSITVSNSIFTDNSVTGDGGAGGVVLSYKNSRVTATNSSFTNNSVIGDGGQGGVVAASDSTITAINTDFTNNSVVGDGGQGGVVLLVHSSSITATNTYFTDNSVIGDEGQGGVVAAGDSAIITATNSTFISNSVIGDGGEGGVLLADGSTITAKNSDFTSNSVIGVGGSGGVVFADSSSITAIDSIFTNNSVSGYNGTGGVLWALSSTITVTTSLFDSNSAIGRGGVVDAGDSTITVASSIFTSNSVTGDHAIGGVVYVGEVASGTHSEIIATNCLFSSNFANGAGGVVFASDSLIIVANSIFTSNSVTGNNGAGGVVFAIITTIAATNSTFNNNSVIGDHGAGGVVAVESSTFTATGSIFTNTFVAGKDHARVGGGGVVLALNSRFTSTNSIFANNSVTGYGGAGGVVLANSGSIIATNSTFSSNSVTGDNAVGGVMAAYTSSISATNNTFSFNSVTGDSTLGGVLYLSNTQSTHINRTFFTYNVASMGAVYMVQSQVHFESTTISNNYGSVFAFTSVLTFNGNTNIMNNSLSNTSPITSQLSKEGGAMTGFQSNFNFNDTINIQYNVGQDGGAISIRESKIYMYGNVTVAYNTAALAGGGIYAYQSELVNEGHLKFIGNTAKEAGGGIHSIASTTRVRGGSVSFIGNQAKRGGGISLMLNAKLYMLRFKLSFTSIENYDRLEFADNNAAYGGAVYVSDTSNSGTCVATSTLGEWSATATNSECFFQSLATYSVATYDNIYHNVTNAYVLTTHFTNNSATVAGGALYGGLLDRCTVSPLAEFFIKYRDLTPSTVSTTSYYLNITNLQLPDFNSRTVVSSDAVRVCICRDNQPECSYHPPSLYVRKGETFKVSLVAVDQVNNTVSNASIHGSVSQGAELGGQQSIQQTNIDRSCTELTYNVLSPHDSEKLYLYAQGPCMGIGKSTASLAIHIVPCPIGFKDMDSLRCDCDPLLLDYVTNCSIDNESVLRKDSTWFDFVNDTKHQGYILHKHCPFDFCQPPTRNVSVNLNNPLGSNELCAYNRSGKLCGSCEDGLSLSLGSSRCMPCSNKWLALLVAFTAAGVALVAFILWCNMTVAVGTINGLNFYANVFSTNRAIFFPLHKPSVLTVFIAWLNLDFGFETCFYDGMNEYAKTWLQLVFPIYIITLVIAIIVISDYSPRFASLFTGKNPVATLATLILLSYTKLLRVIIASLSITTLDYSDGSHDVVWLADGNVPYLKGKHIPLFVTAIVIVIVGIVYTLFLLCWQLLVHFPNKKPWKWIMTSTKVIAFMDAYHNPFHKDHRYWIGLLLLVRVLLYLVSALNVFGDPRINLLSVNTAMVVLVNFQLIAGYKHKIHKKLLVFFIENTSFFNLIMLTSVTYFITEDSESQSVVAYISLAIALATFLVILVYHTYTFSLHKAVRRKIHKLHHRVAHRYHSTSHHDGLESTALYLIPSELESVTVSEIDGLPEPVETDSDEGNYSVEEMENDKSAEQFVGSKSTNTVCKVEFELPNVVSENRDSGNYSPTLRSPHLDEEDSDEPSVEDESTPLLS